jgi:branched-chain amino acid transport system ATP-binding protein
VPLLELRGVEARYGPIKALHDVSLRLEDGEVVALLGANGAGKTTTLRAISGTIRRSGEVTFDGRALGRRSPESIARLGIAHVPEGRGLFAELTVWENLRMGAYSRGERRTLRQEAPRVLGYFPWLEQRRDQQAGTLSGGEQQMLALAMALVSRPRLLMLDEPSLGLAPVMTDVTFEKIGEIHKMGTAILLVEQNVSRALSLVQRAYVLESGNVIMHGSSSELANNKQVQAAYLGI